MVQKSFPFGKIYKNCRYTCSLQPMKDKVLKFFLCRSVDGATSFKFYRIVVYVDIIYATKGAHIELLLSK